MTPWLSPAPFVLLWLRLLPVCVLLPSAAMRRPVVVGPAVLSALLALCLLPLSLVPEAAVSLSALASLRELALGVCFALVAGAPVLALAWFGHVLERVITGPVPGGSAGLSRLYGAFGLALLFGLGGHRVLLEAFVDLVRAVPLTTAAGAPMLATVRAAVAGLGQALVWTLLWAAPFAASLLLFDLFTALVARFVQRAPLAFAAGPLRILCALTVLVLGGAFVADLFPEALARAGVSVRALIQL